MKKPRDYQDSAHNALWAYIHDPNHYPPRNGMDHPSNPLIVEATGLGKSLNIAMFIWHTLNQYPRTRIMQLTHVKELIEGNYLELIGMWPAAPAGIYSAGLGMRHTRAQVTFAGIQSVHKRPATFGHIDFLIIDEAHLLSGKDESMYGRFIAGLRQVNPRLVIIGYTATPFRMSQGMLTDGTLFDEVAYDIGSGESFNWAVDQGYLILPVPTDPGFQLDDSEVSVSAGEFKQSEASKALKDQDILERAVDYSIKVATEEGRQRAICFAQSIEDADLIADMLTYKGFESESVHSKRDDRDEILAAHKRGEFWGIVNKNILTTGYNDPFLDLMIVLRLTRSPGLWTQIVGRITRPVWLPGYDIETREGRWESILASHKQNARVLDFVGNTERLGPINYPNIPKRRGCNVGGEAPVRTCSVENGGACDPATYHHISVKVCPHCGFEFPVETHMKTVASKSELVKKKSGVDLTKPPEVPAPELEIFDVHELTATEHEGRGKKRNTLKATYRSGYRAFHQWVCFDHDHNTYPYKRAWDWWKQHGGHHPPPANVNEALERINELTKPKFIEVCLNMKYPTIQRFDFKGTRFVLNLSGEAEVFEPMKDPLIEGRRKAAVAQEYADSMTRGAGYFDDDIPFLYEWRI